MINGNLNRYRVNKNGNFEVLVIGELRQMLLEYIPDAHVGLVSGKITVPGTLINEALIRGFVDRANHATRYIEPEDIEHDEILRDKFYDLEETHKPYKLKEQHLLQKHSRWQKIIFAITGR